MQLFSSPRPVRRHVGGAECRFSTESPTVSERFVARPEAKELVGIESRPTGSKRKMVIPLYFERVELAVETEEEEESALAAFCLSLG